MGSFGVGSAGVAGNTGVAGRIAGTTEDTKVDGATGRFGIPSPAAVDAAWPRNPSHVSDTDGTPSSSARALARSTAGVQLPQHAIPETTASTPCSRSFAGSPAIVACSSPPWVEPKTR